MSRAVEMPTLSPLGVALTDYLAVRRAMGYKLESHGRVLTDFVAHLDATGASLVTTAEAAAWSTTRGGGAGMRLRCIRGFALYLQALDPRHEVPPVGLIPITSRRATPHLYSEADIAGLMAAARQLVPSLRAAATEMVIGVLAVTGMRIGEVLALDLDDIDWDTGVITIRLAKFNKTRHVPVSPSTLAALADYRHTHRPTAPGIDATKALFVSATGQRFAYSAFADAFHRLGRTTGLCANTATGRRPRIHDFRHGFAVATLLDWSRDGADIHALLPRLSTYLGHRDPASTYWYLSATPELMALTAARLEPDRDDSRIGDDAR